LIHGIEAVSAFVEVVQNLELCIQIKLSIEIKNQFFEAASHHNLHRTQQSLYKNAIDTTLQSEAIYGPIRERDYFSHGPEKV
jgi:hypothetical protein